jgi:5-hydroxyisourate hydrolase
MSGRPAAGIRVTLYRLDAMENRSLVVETLTNSDGRTDAPLLAGDTWRAGTYELVFAIGAYFRAIGAKLADPPFFDVIPLRFTIAGDGHYHVPLVCTPWSYSTYRGS